MKVFMLGWEFPPYISGGLGTACFGLTRALDRLGTQVLFILPRAVEQPRAEHVRIVSPASLSDAGEFDTADASGRLGVSSGQFRHTDFRTLDAVLRPYAAPMRAETVAPAAATAGTPGGSAESEAPRALGAAVGAAAVQAARESIVGPLTSGPGAGANYEGDMFEQVARYAMLACRLARNETFDVIHAHDWMTYPAGMAVKRMSGRPLVVHVHSTEFDRSGEHVNQRIYDVERAGMHAADRVIAVSHYTRNIIIRRYGVDPARVRVVYNAIDENGFSGGGALPPITKHEKIVLFLGRITMQKGPEYFLSAAKRVLEIYPDVRFIMAGSGDMIRPVIEAAAAMGIGHKVLFTGFLRGDDVRRVFRMADLYVMPSVSEPFGIAPLEALSNDVPVLISKQSGVAEVLTHALKVDFWDIDEMVNKIVAVLRHPPLQSTLRDHGHMEVRRMSWADSAAECINVYREAIAGRAS